MSGKRAKAIRRAVLAEHNQGGEYRSKDDATKKPPEIKGSFKRALRAAKRVLMLKGADEYAVTGQIIHTHKLFYRRAKKAWVGRKG